MKLNLKTLGSTLLLSTFLLGGLTAEAKTYTIDDVSVKHFENTFRYSSSEMYSTQFHDGLILVGTYVLDDDGEYLTNEKGWYITDYGYYNTKGELAIPVNTLSWGIETHFNEGLVPYITSVVEDSEDRMIAYMDTTGTLVTESFLCQHASNFRNGVATLYHSEGLTMIDREGNILHSYSHDTPSGEIVYDYSEGLGILGNDYVDIYGNVVIDTDYNFDIETGYVGGLGLFSENIAGVMMSSSLSHERELIFIDKSGNELFRKTADGYGAYVDGLAIIGYSEPKTSGLGNVGSYNPYNFGDYATFMDTTGKEFPEKYVGIRPFSEDLAAVQKKDDFDGDGKTESLWGYIDKTGTLVIDYQFDSPGFFSEGYAFVGKDQTINGRTTTLYAVIDTSGTQLTDFLYYYPRDFSEGLAHVGLLQEGSHYLSDNYYIDTNGNIIIDINEADMDCYGSDFKDGVAFVIHEDYDCSAYIIRNPLLEDGYTTPETTTPSTPSYDSWAESFVTFSSENGLTVDSLGMDFTKSITREQIADLLVNMVEKATGKTLETGTSSFSDTNNPQIAKASTAGIIAGNPNGTFSPDNTATRQEISVMILRAIEKLEELSGKSYIDHNLTELEGFSDMDTIDSWAVGFMAILANNDMMAGSNGKLNPHSETSIQECLVMNNNLFQLGT